MPDAIEWLALNRAAEIAIDLQVQLEKHTATRPMLKVLHLAKKEAAGGMAALVFADPKDALEIARLQLVVQRFDDLVRWCQSIIEQGKFAEAVISEEDREDIAEIVGTEHGEGTS